MRAFYRDTLGFSVYRDWDGWCELHGREAYGAEGRTGIDPRVEASTLDHLALAISKDDLGAEKERLESLGSRGHERRSQNGRNWRSLYVNDPEGNVVE